MSFNKNTPYFASIKERYSLCLPGSLKSTQHIVINLLGSGLTYQVGDSLGIFPANSQHLVEKTISSLGGVGNEMLVDREGCLHSLKDFLTHKANISDISRKLLLYISQKQQCAKKRSFLENLFLEENKLLFKDYLESRQLWEILEENKEVQIPVQELSTLLMPLLPRLYSISSSYQFVGEEVHLTVAYVKYESNGQQRHGVCTHYLCELAPLHHPVIPVYIQPHHGFTLPDPDAPIIMVGPGTGVAPFRAFMQERLMQQASGKNWLFFGEWNQQGHFFYQAFWEELIQAGKLRLDVAFSRDQQHKIYVQHRMLEKGAEIFAWLEKGAYFYVCGDAKKMAKDVEAALLYIIQTHGKMTEEEAKRYLKKLRLDKRYLRDVY
jgi:sulfite reductase (NADPH) flavoprotein alpha-component